MKDRGPCFVADCGRRAWSRGMCNTHLSRWRKTGTTDAPPKRPRRSGKCSVADCTRTEQVTGLCPLHYGRRWRTGSVELRLLTTSDRFWAKVKTGDSDSCWLWVGHVMPNGYGMFYPPARKIPAHRFAYEDAVGPIPPGLHIDHLCCNRGCVNPAHLEAVTQAENNRRAWQVRRQTA